jgi:hypothetical protein
VKGFLYFLLGAGIGSGVTYIFTKRYCNKKNDAEIEKLEAYYKDKVPQVKHKEPVQKAPAIDEKPSEEALKLEKAKQYTRDFVRPVKGSVTDYAAKYKLTREENTDPIPDGNKPYTDEDVEAQMEKEIRGMVIISGDEWDNDEEYDKVEVTYYENDDIFVDAYGRALENLTPDDVGRPNLSYFGVSSGEEGVLYVRDEDNSTDYRINLEEAPYEG